MILITSTVGAEFTLTATSVESIVKGFLNPSLPRTPGKTNVTAIKESHQFLTEKVVMIKIALSGGHNRYLGIVLLPEKYS